MKKFSVAASVIAGLALVLASCVGAFAQTATAPPTYTTPGGSSALPQAVAVIGLDSVTGARCFVGTVSTCAQPSPAPSGSPTSVTPAASAVTGSVAAATITNSSAQVVAAASRKLLAIDNESTTATIACAFGGTATVNTAGSYTIPPGYTRTWNSYPVPADAVNCISTAATSPATVETN